MKKNQTFVMAFSNRKRETLTVAGLLNALSSFDPDLPVAAMWEGVECPILEKSIYEAKLECAVGKPTVLYFDVDEHF